jgi:YD repeat-containing protein
LAVPSFGYDAADRLTSVSRSGDAQSYSWDTVGNRTGHTRQGASAGYTMSGSSNRLASVGGTQWRNFGYGASGSVTSEARFDRAGNCKSDFSPELGPI